jgi:hypothetical protein
MGREKTIFEKQEFDLSTGEVTSVSRIVKKEVPKDQFVFCYVNDICTLQKCPQSEIGIVLGCLPYLDYNTNEVVLSPARKKKIAQECNITDGTFRISIMRLFQKNILIKMVEEDITKTYLNPRLFFFGNDIHRAEVLQLTIEYKLKD